MSDVRLTMQTAGWATTGFLDAAIDLLTTESEAAELRMYFYAVTLPGWNQIATATNEWMTTAGRPAVAYVGTDHALTDPESLEAMAAAGVDVRMLLRYHGTYHPKLLWFVGRTAGLLLGGSNNLTLDGLKGNIEFATLMEFAAQDRGLEHWHNAIHAASDPMTPPLLDSYRRERVAFERRRVAAGVGTFTWRRRSSGAGPTPTPPSLPTLEPLGPGDLIVEIMPLETGADGKQIQIPSAAAGVFGLPAGVGATVAATLVNAVTADRRVLTMTRFSNRTSRLTFRELSPRDRPCVLVFRRAASGDAQFEIVREAVDPSRYRRLLGLAINKTRAGSRRWAVTL